MSDRFFPLGPGAMAAWIRDELDSVGSIFGIPKTLFFVPSSKDRFTWQNRGSRIETPIGVAAGPHTQLAQNIVVAWLCGARVIELKTVQTLDRIEVAKPCIDMQDAGYNIEWSQELTVRQSYEQYLMAWFLIHCLHSRLGFPGDDPGIVFDLSVGYDLDGLVQDNMRWYLRHAADAADLFEACASAIEPWFPEVRDLEIPRAIADSVTVSTLHGCPPEEIGAIAEHLMGKWGLHTAVKLNPTLLGFEMVREILADDLGWSQIEPHKPAFDADIRYDDALVLLDRLSDSSRRRGVDFGIKLCNTLPVVNARPEFSVDESAAYLSGRPLHALAVELARRLTADSAGSVPVSFAGGADAFNTPALLAAGMRPVTTCSDLLRPGGYLRLGQYLEEINTALDRIGAANLDAFIVRTADIDGPVEAAARINLDRYADGIRTEPSLERTTYRRGHTKTKRPLGFFDCIEAPCTDACSVNQRVPAYMRAVASGDVQAAAEIIRTDNPLPSILGRACHHPCEPVCLRTHMDQPVAIREIKRYVTDHATPAANRAGTNTDGPRVAIIGAGPCGLAAASELARSDISCVVFDARERGGGMVSATIPGYRAAPHALERDLKAVAALGVEFEYGVAVGPGLPIDELMDRGYDHVVVAAGAQQGLRLGIDGEDLPGVLDGLDFLRAARNDRPQELGDRIGVVGGGDVAMDCARSARRFTGKDVQILYRRTVDQMPAHPEEIADLLAEGITIRELVAPERITSADGRLRSVDCTVMTLGEPDASGRRRPVPVQGGSVSIELDTLIVAIGQRADLGIFDPLEVEITSKGYVVSDPDTLETSVPGIYVGGDLRDPGPSSIVDACGDGRRIARSILAQEGHAVSSDADCWPISPDRTDLLRRRSRRNARVATPRTLTEAGAGFSEVILTLDRSEAESEAARCLDCDLYCSTCDGVCPNRAIVTYELAESTLAAEQTPQVAVLADFCNECGNCATFCPTAGSPWRDKPRIYFDRDEFEAQPDNAFMLLRINSHPAIQGRFNGETLQLVMGDDPVATAAALTMTALLRGLTESLPHLPMPEALPGWLATPG
jgi:putative selenate reductase